MMSGLVSTINFLHLVSAAGFLLVTFALLGVSAVNRLRLRRPLLAWRPLSIRTAPWAPLIFSVLIVAASAVAGASGQALPGYFLFGYALGSLAWLAASYISATVVICECGIVADVHRRDKAVAWGQVTDYFEIEKGCVSEFVFLHQDDDKRQRRLEVCVPRRLRDEFVAIVDVQLGTRVDVPDWRAHGTTALEG